MSISKKLFGTLPGGEDVYLYTITNKNGAQVSIQTLGGGIQSLYMPDRNGAMGDVVLGFDNVSDYQDPDLGYQGLLVGRFANRIRNAQFEIDGEKYNLPANQGSWTLHGGGRFSFSLWEAAVCGENSITVAKFSPDGEDGFPGNFTMRVKYTLTDENVLRLEYFVSCDKKSVANPTNHVYFNLSADPKKTIEGHTLQIDASYFTETDSQQLPTGVLSPVAGTMMDFTCPHKIGDRIDEPFRAVIDGVGYDNNYCLDKKYGEFARAAVLYDEESGRRLAVYTDLPGVQLYCGGWLAGSCGKGKGNSKVSFRRGVALETQFYPDSVHFPDKFPFEYICPGKEFKTVTEFRFTAE
ncbi:MAG: galactose mutarotase [Clostridiales bacterium]|nr:galactose mutarotase [Clostridiales bacterium]